MKKVLIISPHFPPVNAPDMQRVRMSLPFYKAMGWEPVVLCVAADYVSGFMDELLSETVPDDIEVHKTKAWPEKLTRKFGMGNLSLRAYYHLKKKGTELLQAHQFDLVFFSTSQFYICTLGPHWKKKFGIPFIIDMQDPWRNDFYLHQHSSKRPAKFRLMYALDKQLEASTMPFANGIISVSQAYIDTLQQRYHQLKYKPTLLLPFGTSSQDFDLVYQKNISPRINKKNKKEISVVYVGVLNKFFMPLIKAFFTAFSLSITNKDDYHFYFVGTNYYDGIDEKPVEHLAGEFDMSHLVTEIPNRVPYFSALATLLYADVLFIPGSTDAGYNASKIYNNIQSGKPIFSIFNEKSYVKKAIDENNAGIFVGVHENDDAATMADKVIKAMPAFKELHLKVIDSNQAMLQDYMAEAMVEKQVAFFDRIVSKSYRLKAAVLSLAFVFRLTECLV
ncbi:MAG: hypothetical protein ABIN57_01970 [Chitinophagaceae bacterium]